MQSITSLIFILITILTCSVQFTLANGVNRALFYKFIDDLLAPKWNMRLDYIVDNVIYWSNNYETRSRFPQDLRNVVLFNSQNCDLQSLTAKSKQLDSYDPKKYGNIYSFLDYFFRLQANICWQNSEERRWSSIGQNLDKFKWIAWYEAISVLEEKDADGKNNVDHNVKIVPEVNVVVNEHATDIAAKFARHLKRYVPGIESKNFASPSEHKTRILLEIDGIMRHVCPYFVTVSEEKNLLEFLGKAKGGDGIGDISSLSQQLCKFDPTRMEFINVVYSHFMDNLDKIVTIDREVTNLEEVKEMLYGSNNELDQFKVRVKNPMVLVEQFYKLSKDKSANITPQEYMTRQMLYELRQFFSSHYPCLRPSLNSKLGFEKTLATNPESPLSSYIKSLNALKFERCHATMGRIASEASVKYNPYQLARLYEIRQRMIKNQSSLDRLMSTDLRVSSSFASGIAQYIFDDMKRDDIGPTYKATIEFKSRGSVIDIFHRLMEQVCWSVVETMSGSLDIYEALNDTKLMKNRQLGETTRMLIDYGRICHYHVLVKSQAGSVRDKFLNLASSIGSRY